MNKVDPGIGYRLLGEDEPAIEGDGYTAIRSNGTPIDDRWYEVWGLAGRTSQMEHGQIIFRRKVEHAEMEHFI